MKSLKAIQTLSKIGKVLSTIVYICCMIGAIACGVSVALFAVYGDKAIMEARKNAVQMSDMSIVESVEKINLPGIITALAVATVICAANAVVAKFAQNYFKHELEDGTPFTLRGANELKRLGIIDIAVKLGTSIVCGAGVSIASKSIETLEGYDFEGLSIGLGITFLIVSVILRYGAELTEGKTGAAASADQAYVAAPVADAAPVAYAAPAAETAPAAEEAPAEAPAEV